MSTDDHMDKESGVYASSGILFCFMEGNLNIVDNMDGPGSHIVKLNKILELYDK